jgi:hypothetical protein
VLRFEYKLDQENWANFPASGELELSEGKHVVNCESNQYRVLSASISYFKAKSGDKLTILIPEDQPSEWAAVENLYESIS